MSYQALARKWRPQRFDELVGQEHVVRALQHGLDNDRLHHALLFSGTRGVGKTTLGRLVAKGLNCEQGVTAEPCGKCENCLAIEQGRFVDLIEVDAASRTGVDDTRELLNNVQYAPARGRCKVYLIDEVHMLSKSAFNALLKTLEEPPEHVRFLLATTDPQKLPITVLSRCLQFHLKQLPRRDIQGRLQSILDEEGVNYETGATELLARAADGSLRDGISLLDQAIAFGHGQLKTDDVGEMLGSIARRDVVALLDALAISDAGGLFDAINRLDEQAPDYATALNELAYFLQRIAVIQLLPDLASDDDELTSEQLRLASTFSPEDVQLLYQIAITGKRDLSLAPDPRSGFEMTLLRMLSFSEVQPPHTEEPDSSLRRKASKQVADPDRQMQDKQPTSEKTATVVSSQPESDSAQPAVQELQPTRDVSSTPEATRLPAQAGPEAWADLVSQLGLVGMADQMARHCAWVDYSENQFLLRLSPNHEALFGDRHKTALEQALKEKFGGATTISIELVEPEAPTPAAIEASGERERQRQAEAALAADPRVNAIGERFGAQLHPGSVEAVD